MSNQCGHGQLARVCELCEKDAEIAALRAELAKHQESEFHPDWSMLAATRESLREHQQMIRELQAEVTQLRQYLDTAQRRASALGDEVAGLREVVESAAAADEYYDHPLAIQRLALMARAALEFTHPEQER